ARTDTIVVGQSGRLSAVAVDASGAPIPGQTVIWSGSAPDLAAVAPDGTIVGLAPGAFVATATSVGRSIGVSVTIREGVESRARTVDVFPREVVLAPGLAHPVAAIARDAAGAALEGAIIRLHSLDTTIAAIDPQGRVVGRAPGATRVEVVVGAARSSLAVRVERETEGEFDVGLRLLGDAQAIAAEARRAADRWERVVQGDLPEVAVALPAAVCGFGVPALDETVDDVLVIVRLDSLDGPGATIATANPCVARQQSRLTVLGVIRVDIEDLAAMRAAGALESVLAHEIGHVLGLGTSWRDAARGLLTDAASAAPGYVGERGRRAAAWLGFTSGEAVAVPVEGTGGPGTRGLHWRESVLARELMTGWIDEGAPLSAVSVGALADLGYVVRESGADAFSSHLAGSVDARRLAALFGAPAPPRPLEEQVGTPVLYLGP
ncbi:MAG TPA: leishmanolysin-related zinc metalloendopeptidase, partial [Gemmatimonadaceae bacterium]|nr:leishmanolysin-related zinc metalloendopeptidase [Gemmatimonadaceae bacterium]